VNVIAGAVAFVVVTIASEVEEIEFVDEALFFQEIDGAIDGDEVDSGVDFLGAGQDLVDVEMLFGVVHYLEDHAALAGHADAAFGEDLLESAGGFGGVETFTGGGAVGWRGCHESFANGS